MEGGYVSFYWVVVGWLCWCGLGYGVVCGYCVVGGKLGFGLGGLCLGFGVGVGVFRLDVGVVVYLLFLCCGFIWGGFSLVIYWGIDGFLLCGVFWFCFLCFVWLWLFCGVEVLWFFFFFEG